MHMKNSKFLYFVLLFCFVRGFAQNDCVNAIVVCGDTGFTGLTVSGAGVQEVNSFNACSSEENNSIWLKLSINSNGTLAFVLHPESSDIQEDFDFWLYGPNVTCGNLGTAIRCSTTNPQLSGADDNLTGMSDLESDVEEGPGPNGNNYVQSVVANAGDTYYLVFDRPVGFSNFSLEWTGTAVFNQQPILPTANLDLQQCDSDLTDDGSTIFDLSQNEATILGSQAGVVVTYHLSNNDAITGANPISDPVHFVNTSNPQQIFVRLTNSGTDCFNATDFSVQVNNTLPIPNTDYTMCDDGSDGDGSNGKTNFNLDTVTAALFAGINISGYQIKYYSSGFNALNDILGIAVGSAFSFYNTTPNQEILYIKASDPISGCSRIEPITLHVMPQPSTVNASLVQCDTGLNPDGITTFNLNEAVASFTAGNPNLGVTFYESGNPVALNSNYTNTGNPQILTAKISDLTNGCSNMSTLTLIVNVIPSQVITIPAQCDIINIENGLSHFDLNTANISLTATQTLAFYETLNDALLEQNQIANSTNYQNTTPYHAVIYVRIEDSNSCSSVSEMELVVHKLPVVVRNSDGFYVCPEVPEHYIAIDAAIKQGQPADYTYIWHLDGRLLPQTAYEILVNQAGTYTVDVTAQGCTITRTITVLNSNNAIIESVVVDDLTADVNTIQVNLSAGSIGDYVFSLDNGPFQESGFFGNVEAGIHDLFIKDLKACGVLGPIQVDVLGAPRFFTPNGDGLNDNWNLKGVDPNSNKNSMISIFDRNGKLLKQISPLGLGWDGTYNKKQLPAEDYWYHITLQNGRSAKGHFTLKR